MPQLTLRLRITLAFLSIYTIWGSTYLAIRFAIETFPPFLMAGLRFLIAGGVLYAWTRFRVPRVQRVQTGRPRQSLGDYFCSEETGAWSKPSKCFPPA